MRTVHRLDPADGGDVSDADPYPLLTALIVPRPIAWISTVDADGVVNLAPHSFFSVAAAHPPVVCWTSVGHKDTLANVRATGEFVVNVTPRWLLEAVNDSSAPFPTGVSEPDRLGLALEPSEVVAPPRVVDSPASMECRLHSQTEIGDSVHVLGTVVAVTVRDEALVDGRPDVDRLAPLARLGGNLWALPGETVEVRRPRRVEDVGRS